MSAATQFHDLVKAWRAGELAARDNLIALVYQEVRAIARRHLARHAGHTLQPTELAHEALIRVLQQTGEWESRRHLMNVIGLATRQVLVDAARRRLARKREVELVSEEDAADAHIATPDSPDIDAALEALTAVDARSAEVIILTYFVGLERNDIAGLLQTSVSSVDRCLRFGRAWLKQELGPGSTGHGA